MSDTPRTDALDCELHNPRIIEDRYSSMADFARELERENAQLRAWIEGLDLIVENTKEPARYAREWHGEVGWVYPGQAAYLGERREEVLKPRSDG